MRQNPALGTTIKGFLGRSDGDLLREIRSAFDTAVTEEQDGAWEDELVALRPVLSELPASCADWALVFEWVPPLLPTRLDLVVVAGVDVFVVEFKQGAAAEFKATNRRQVLSYAEDLYWFHRGARGRRVHALLVATRARRRLAKPAKALAISSDELPSRVLEVGPDGMRTLLESAADDVENSGEDHVEWTRLPYVPRPTIVQAAVGLVAQIRDPNVTMPLADDDELDRVVAALAALVHRASDQRQRVVAFVTGVPGAGKTLVGLRLAHDASVASRLVADGSVPLYLSGNLPLVKVLTAAIVQDHLRHQPATARRDAEVRSRAMVQLIHDFTKHYHRGGGSPDTPVVVFDEAQRSWDAARMRDKKITAPGESMSEPEVVLRIMERQPWSAVVALVGAGQEINTGEAGIATWYEAIASRNAAGAAWQAFAPGTVQMAGVERNDSLHLTTSRRAQGMVNVADWVESVLDGRLDDAASLMASTSGFEIRLTRDLTTARRWLRAQPREFRPGLVASCRAVRLRAYGLEVQRELLDKIDWPRWFLDLPASAHSSYRLEVPATEFKCQGLELDYVGVCWGWDFTPNTDGKSWDVMRFHPGRSEWRAARSHNSIRFSTNAYRVLLTRARRGMVLWVPPGDPGDQTIPAAGMDRTADALERAGAVPLA